MKYTVIIPGRLPCLNDLLAAERVSFRGKYGKLNNKGNVMKKESQDYIIRCIRKDIGRIRIDKPVILHYMFYELNRRRDIDNVASYAMKVFQDSLVLSNVIDNDGWKNIRGFDCGFYVDASKPRIVVVIEEI